MPTRTTRTVRIEPAADATIVADALDGSAPAVVYLHGLTSVRQGEKSHALFEFARGRGLAAWRFDFRGHGDSSGTVDSTTLTELIEDAVAVLERAGPSVIVGSSLGGLVGAWTAALHPELVQGLTLLAPAFAFLPRLLTCEGPDGSAIVPSGSGEVRLGPRVLRDLRRYDEATLPGRLRTPTQIVHGAIDEAVPVDASRSVFDAIVHERKELWIVPDGDHRLNRPIREIYDRMATFHSLP